MNKFFKKMLATSATILVLGQLNPALSAKTIDEIVGEASLFEAIGKDGANHDARQQLVETDLKAKLTHWQEAERLAAPAPQIILDYEQAQVDLGTSRGQLATFQDELRIIEEEIRVKQDRINEIEDNEIYKLDLATLPVLVDGSLQLQDDLKDLQTKNEILLRRKKVREAFNGKNLKPNEQEEALLNNGFDLTPMYNDVANKKGFKPNWQKTFFTFKDAEALKNFTEQENKLQDEITTAQQKFTHEQNNQRNQIDLKTNLENELNNLKREVTALEGNKTRKEGDIARVQADIDTKQQYLVDHQANYDNARALQTDYAKVTINLLKKDEDDYYNLLETYKQTNQKLGESEIELLSATVQASSNLELAETYKTFLAHLSDQEPQNIELMADEAIQAKSFEPFNGLETAIVNKVKAYIPGAAAPVVPAGDVVEKAEYDQLATEARDQAARIETLQNELNAKEAEIINLKASNAPAYPLANPEALELWEAFKNKIASALEDEQQNIIKLTASLLGKPEETVRKLLGGNPNLGVPTTNSEPEDTDSSTEKLELNADQYNFIYTGKFRNLLTCVGGKTVEISSKAKSAQKENIKKEALKLGLVVKE